MRENTASPFCVKTCAFGRKLLLYGLVWLPLAVFAGNYNVPQTLGPDQFSWRVVRAFLSNKNHSLITGLLGDPKLRASYLQVSYHQYNEDPRFKLLIANTMDILLEFNVICLVDYKQVEFSFNGKKALSHSIKLPARQQDENGYEIPDANILVEPFNALPPWMNVSSIELSRLPVGAHDVIIIGFHEDRGKDILHRGFDFSRRLNIFVGSDDFPKVSYESVRSRAVNTNTVPLIIDPGTLLNTDETQSASLVSSTSYDTQVANNDEHPKQYAMIAVKFKDDFAVATAPRYFYLKGKHQGKVSVDKSFFQKSESAKIVLMENPFSLMEKRHGELVKKPRDTMIKALRMTGHP